MRMARLKVPEDRELGFYNCTSRVVDRRFVLEEVEKDHFVSLMRECEAFCEVSVLTFCVMSNHFHILVEVSKRPEKLPAVEEMMAKLRQLSGHQNLGALEQRFKAYRAAKDEAGEAELLASYHARMWNVSGFMKLLKQRFTQWYNGRAGRKGTLWEDRFKSVVVDGQGQALMAMAAYIDLNPVRARLVEDPRDYRWSGYGEAMAGRRAAKEGLRKVAAALLDGVLPSFNEAVEAYRVHLYNQGGEAGEAAGPGKGDAVQGPLNRDAVMKVLDAKGRVPLADLLKCRVRYFCDGAVLGSREFVEDLFNENRERFGPKRKTGARRLKGLEGKELFALRDLRLRVFE